MARQLHPMVSASHPSIKADFCLKAFSHQRPRQPLAAETMPSSLQVVMWLPLPTASAKHVLHSQLSSREEKKRVWTLRMSSHITIVIPSWSFPKSKEYFLQQLSLSHPLFLFFLERLTPTFHAFQRFTEKIWNLKSELTRAKLSKTNYKIHVYKYILTFIKSRKTYQEKNSKPLLWHLDSITTSSLKHCLVFFRFKCVFS